MISDLDVIRACRDAQACMTPPSSLEAVMRRYGVGLEDAGRAMISASEKGYVAGKSGNLNYARPTEAGLRLLRESE